MKNLLKNIILFSVFIFPTIITPKQKNKFRPQVITKTQEFYFIRHGQTDQNIGKVSHDIDVSLNKLGVQQSEEAKLFLKKLPIKTICYSPLLRTTKTAQIIQSELKVPTIPISELEEIMTQDYLSFSLLQIEGFSHASKSTQAFVTRVAKGTENALMQQGSVLIVAHRGVYSAICYILDATTDSWSIDNCDVVHFYKDSDKKWHAKKIFHPSAKQVQTDHKLSTDKKTNITIINSL